MNGNTSARSSRLPGPSSGIKPPQINVGNAAKRKIDATSNSTAASVSNPKQAKTTVGNLTKVTNPQTKAALVPGRPIRAVSSISNLSVPRTTRILNNSTLSTNISKQETSISSNVTKVIVLTGYYTY